MGFIAPSRQARAAEEDLITATDPLEGRRILVVEDEYFIAYDLAQALMDRGAEVVGPVATIDDALELIAADGQLDGAVLDLNLQGEMAFPVADKLLDRGVPLIFATGYVRAVVPERYARVRRFEKPVNAGQLASTLFS